MNFCTAFFRPLGPWLILLVAGSTFARADYAVKEAFRHSHAFDAEGRVHVENVNGSIEVRTWDRNEILIEGQKRAHNQEDLQAIQLSVEVSEQRAEVKVRLPKRPGGWFSGGSIRAEVRMVVTVPTTVALDRIETVNGDVTVADVRGPVQLETVNGSITAKDLGGNASLETVNGRIEASFARLAPGQDLSAESVNGRITLRLPEDAGATLRASVVNGGISCEFPFKSTNSSSKRKVAGTIGDGRASISAQTVNGGIQISRP